MSILMKVTNGSILGKDTSSSGETFLNLTDTPSSYSGQKGLFAVVSEDETKIEFKTDNSIKNALIFGG